MVVTVNFTNKGQPSSGGDFSKKSYKPNGSQRNQGQSSARQSNGHQHDGRRSNYGSGKPNNNQKRYTLRCQFCEQMGHTVKHCPKLQSKDFTVNCVTSSNGKDKTWLMDSATPHNIMGDLANLSIHNEYDGTDEVILGDGSGLTISHIGSLESHAPNRTFILSDTFCVPNLSKNLIFIHHLTKQNNVVVEFHHFHFFVNEKITGAILLRGACENSVYIFPESMMSPISKMVANVHEWTSIDGWNKRLGHPSLWIVQHLVKNFSLPVVKEKNLYLPVSKKKIFLDYVVHAQLIKHINNLFIPIVFKVMHHLDLFILMFGDLHIIPVSTNLIITSFWLTTSQNTCGSIQWLQNPGCLQFFLISKNL